MYQQTYLDSKNKEVFKACCKKDKKRGEISKVVKKEKQKRKKLLGHGIALVRYALAKRSSTPLSDPKLSQDRIDGGQG